MDRQRNRMLCRRMGRLFGQVAKKPQADAVHHFRTTARRIEAILEAVGGDPDRNQRRLTKRLAKLRRRAGRVRDMDVQMARLRSLKIGSDSHRKERLLETLADLRSKQEKRLLEALDARTIRVVTKRLKKAAERLDLFREPKGKANAGVPPKPEFDPVQTALRMFARVARAQGPLRDDNLHAYRLETKQVRYVAEMAGEDEIGKQIVSRLKRMQDAIGEWHDWLALAERAEQVVGNGAESPLIAALKNVTRAKFREALAVCTEERKNLLELAKVTVPARKPVAGASESANAATA